LIRASRLLVSRAPGLELPPGIHRPAQIVLHVAADFDITNKDHGLYSEAYPPRPVSIDASDGGDDTSGLDTCR
jgi:hypothetical protein